MRQSMAPESALERVAAIGTRHAYHERIHRTRRIDSQASRLFQDFATPTRALAMR
jgi:hypothetical protein